MRGKTLLVLAGLLGAGLLGYRYLPPHLNPLAPLALDDPPGWLTSFKLRRLTADQCASLLAEANRRRLIASQPVADSEGSCPLHNVVRVANFGSVTLSSSFLASCPLALSSAVGLGRHGLHVPAPRPGNHQTVGVGRRQRQGQQQSGKCGVTVTNSHGQQALSAGFERR